MTLDEGALIFKLPYHLRHLAMSIENIKTSFPDLGVNRKGSNLTIKLLLKFYS